MLLYCKVFARIHPILKAKCYSLIVVRYYRLECTALLHICSIACKSAQIPGFLCWLHYRLIIISTDIFVLHCASAVHQSSPNLDFWCFVSNIVKNQRTSKIVKRIRVLQLCFVNISALTSKYL